MTRALPTQTSDPSRGQFLMAVLTQITKGTHFGPLVTLLVGWMAHLKYLCGKDGLKNLLDPCVTALVDRLTVTDENAPR